ncbi:MAG: DUF2238 domain-containing protein [Planctomycetota bacterium]|nr:DUF2238 domain-containing protein [Planctomycetota bacterium]
MLDTSVRQPPIARILLVLYVVLFVVCGIAPHDRAVWVAENAPIVMLVGILIWIARSTRLSTTSWIFCAFLPALHTIGGHYTFEHVPFDWVTELFGFERNHYDRMAHFTVGFLAYPLAELCARRELIRARWILMLFPVTVILSVAALYELFEWWYAISADPEAGIAVLGSQGDVWDAQKDILADWLGALLAMGVFLVRGRRDEVA